MPVLRPIARFVVPMCLFVGMCAVTAPSLAQDSVVVADFSGRGGKSARNAVVKALGDYTLIPRADFESTAKEAGADLKSDAGLGLAATKTGARIVVVGRVTGRSARTVVTMRAIGQDGNELAKERVRGNLRLGKTAVKLKRAAKKLVKDALGGAPAAAAVAADAEEGGDKNAQGGDAGAADVSEEEEEEDSPGDAKTFVPHLLLAVGAQGRTREASFQRPTGVSGYSLGFSPELVVHLEAHPFAALAPAVQGIYLQADFAYALSVSSEDAVAMASFESSAWRLSIDLGYLHPFAKGAFRFGLVVRALSLDNFDISNNTVLPSSSYLTAGTGGGLLAIAQIAGPVFQLRGEFIYQYVLGVGSLSDETNPAFLGAYNGGHRIYGKLSVGGELSFFTYWLYGGLSNYWLDFAAIGTAPGGASGTDTSFELGLLIGLVLR